MHKKTFISLAIILSVILLLSTNCFAKDDEIKNFGESMQNTLNDAKDGVSNTINNVEDTTEGVAGDIENGSKNITNSMENTMNNIGDSVKEGMDNAGQKMNNTMNDTYSAIRTSADGNSTFMGMGATAWTWLILGVAALAIVAVVWYYSMQLSSSKYNNRGRR